MPGINLLPDELRAKEGKELEIVKKNPKEVKIELSQPAKDQPAKPAKPPFWSRLFSRQPAKPKPPVLAATKPAAIIKKEEEKKPPVAPVFNKPVVSEPKPPAFQPFQPLAPKPAPTLTPTPVPAPKPILSARPLEIKPAPKPAMPEPYKSQILMAINKHEESAKEAKLKKPKRSWLAMFSRKKKEAVPKKTEQNKEAKGKKNEPKKEKINILDINLMPADLMRHPELEISKKLIIGSMIILIAILAVAGGYLGLTWYQIKVTREIGLIRDQIVKLDADIATNQQQTSGAVAIQGNLKTIKELLNSHIYWTKFFGLLEKYTLADVFYTNFSMSGKEKLTIAATGRDYITVAKQLVAFQDADDFAKTVKIDAAAAQTDDKNKISGVTFTINLDLGPDVFSRPITQ